MPSPSPNSSPEYDIDLIHELVKAGDGWSKIQRNIHANPNKCDRRNVERYYERHKPIRRKRVGSNPTNPGHNQLHKRENRTAHQTLNRNYDPARNPPTGYISNLDNDAWIKHYFGGDGSLPTGHEWDDVEYLTELRESLWNELNLIELYPRGHGKTTSVIELFTRYLLEVKRPLLCIKSGNAGARWMFGEVRKLMMLTSIRQDYGDVMESMNRSTQEMYYSYDIAYASSDPAFRCVGKGGEIIGLHSGWIHLDDIIQEEAKSEMTREGLRNWYDDVVKYCVVRGENPTRITFTGTRKDMDDFYSYIMAKRFKIQHKRSIEIVSGRLPNFDECEFDEYGMPIKWPETGVFETLSCPNWTFADLLYAYYDDPIGFASQMQNDPVPRGGLFFAQEEWIEVDDPLIDYTANHTFVDPAFGKTAASSDTAILVLTVHKGDLVLLDASVGKYDPPMLENETVRLSTRHGSISTHLENNYAQITSRFTEDRPIRNLRGVRTFEQKIDKIDRIDAFKAPLSTRRVKVHVSCNFKDKIKAQFLKYNRRKGAWDILDCWTTGYLYLSRYMRRSTREGKLKVGAYGNRFE